MGDFHAQVDIYSPKDAIAAFCSLQGRLIYKAATGLNLPFASEFSCGCKPYIQKYKLDYEPLRTPLIPWQLPPEDSWVSSLRSSRQQPNLI